MLHRIIILLAYVAALFVVCVSKLQGPVAQMRGQGSLKLLVVASNPSQRSFAFFVILNYLTSFAYFSGNVFNFVLKGVVAFTFQS